MTIEAYSEPIDDARAAKVGPKAQLLAIQCVAIAAKQHAWPQLQNLGFNVRTPINPTWMRAGDMTNAVFQFHIDMHTTENGANEPVIFAHIELAYRIAYSIPADVEVFDLRHFVAVSGMMHLWPYVRAEVQYLTTQIGLPPLVLPLLMSGMAKAIVQMGAPLDAPALAQAPVVAGVPET